MFPDAWRWIPSGRSALSEVRSPRGCGAAPTRVIRGSRPGRTRRRRWCRPPRAPRRPTTRRGRKVMAGGHRRPTRDKGKGGLHPRGQRSRVRYLLRPNQPGPLLLAGRWALLEEPRCRLAGPLHPQNQRWFWGRSTPSENAARSTGQLGQVAELPLVPKERGSPKFGLPLRA
jgi:hypothetical protein